MLKSRAKNANESREPTCSVEGKKVSFQLAQSHNGETGYFLIGRIGWHKTDAGGTGLARRRRSCGRRRLSKEGQKMPRTINLSCLAPLVYRGQRQNSKRKEQRAYILRSAEVMRVQGVPDIIGARMQ